MGRPGYPPRTDGMAQQSMAWPGLEPTTSGSSGIILKRATSLTSALDHSAIPSPSHLKRHIFAAQASLFADINKVKRHERRFLYRNEAQVIHAGNNVTCTNTMSRKNKQTVCYNIDSTYVYINDIGNLMHLMTMMTSSQKIALSEKKIIK